MEKAGLKYLDTLFRKKGVHDSSLKMIKASIKDHRFVPDSKDYGKMIVLECLVRNEESRKVVKQLVAKTSKSQEVKAVTADLLQDIAN
jgi:hypothetical protein